MFDIQDFQHTFSGGKYARIKAISSLENPVEFPNQDCIDPTLLVRNLTMYYGKFLTSIPFQRTL